MLGRHGQIAESTVGRRFLLCINHLPLQDKQRRYVIIQYVTAGNHFFEFSEKGK